MKVSHGIMLTIPKKKFKNIGNNRDGLQYRLLKWVTSYLYNKYGILISAVTTFFLHFYNFDYK